MPGAHRVSGPAAGSGPALALWPVTLLLMVPLILLVGTDPAAAQAFTPDFPGDVPDEVLERGRTSIDEINAVDTAFQNLAEDISKELKQIAHDLLLSLLLIELVWTFGRIVMNGPDIGRILSELFQRVVITGFFLFLIDGIPTFGGDTIGIAKFIIRAAEGLGNATVETSIRPADVFGDIYRAGAQVYYETSGAFAGFRRLAAALVWLVLIFVGAIIAGIMLVAYVQIYVVFTAGIVALGFGAWRETSNIARNFLFAGLGKIFRLFTVLLMVAVIRVQLGSLTTGFASFEDGMVMIGMLVIFIMTLIVVPAQVESIVAGGSAPSAEGRVAEAATYAPREAAKGVVGAGLGAAAKGTRSAFKVGTKAAGDRLAASIRPIHAGGRP